MINLLKKKEVSRSFYEKGIEYAVKEVQRNSNNAGDEVVYRITTDDTDYDHAKDVVTRIMRHYGYVPADIVDGHDRACNIMASDGSLRYHSYYLFCYDESRGGYTYVFVTPRITIRRKVTDRKDDSQNEAVEEIRKKW